MKKFMLCLLIFYIMGIFSIAAAEKDDRLKDIFLWTNSFNPFQNERCELSYILTEDATVSVLIYTSDFDLIKKVEDKLQKKKGKYQVFWDGRDFEGKIVPDEAYFFCVEATFKDYSQEIYDPTTFSGGDEFDITQVDYDLNHGLFLFKLNKPSRVLMRIGLKNGPLMATLLGWEVKPAGNNLVYWSGYDSDNVINLLNHPNLVVATTGFELPNCSVLTYGNKQYDYFSYKKSLQTDQKPRRDEVFRAIKISPNYYYLRKEDRAPKFSIEFPQSKANIPQINGEVLIRIAIDKDTKEFLLKNRFEVILFLDGKFICEEEEGYTPFNLIWNSKGVKPGEHFLTVNLTSYLGQVGSKTVKVTITN